jgi:hypothetical protein
MTVYVKIPAFGNKPAGLAVRLQKTQPMCESYHIALSFSLLESVADVLMTLT